MLNSNKFFNLYSKWWSLGWILTLWARKKWGMMLSSETFTWKRDEKKEGKKKKKLHTFYFSFGLHSIQSSPHPQSSSFTVSQYTQNTVNFTQSFFCWWFLFISLTRSVESIACCCFCVRDDGFSSLLLSVVSCLAWSWKSSRFFFLSLFTLFFWWR